jgi:ferric-dicitrate binding protein FerR (iron transport regulator)
VPLGVDAAPRNGFRRGGQQLHKAQVLEYAEKRLMLSQLTLWIRVLRSLGCAACAIGFVLLKEGPDAVRLLPALAWISVRVLLQGGITLLVVGALLWACSYSLPALNAVFGLYKRVLDRLRYLSAIYELRLITPADLPSIYPVFQQALGLDLIPPEAVAAWMKKNPLIAYQVVRLIPGRPDHQEMVGYFEILPLTKSGEAKLRRDYPEPRELKATDIRSPLQWNRARAYYIASVGVNGPMSSGGRSVSQSERALIERTVVRMLVKQLRCLGADCFIDVYARPATEDGLRLIHDHDFRKLQPNLPDREAIWTRRLDVRVDPRRASPLRMGTLSSDSGDAARQPDAGETGLAQGSVCSPAVRYQRRASYIVATLIPVVCALIFFRPSVESKTKTYRTDIGEYRNVTLADGSVVTLNTDTTIVVRYTDHARDVQLVKGEAFFNVAHNRARPFSICSKGMTALAVGTRFDIDASQEGVKVMVTEGEVKVGGGCPAASGAVSMLSQIYEAFRIEGGMSNQLHAGEVAEWSEERLVEPIAAVDTEEIERSLAWQHGSVVFRKTPLSDALVQLNRYSRRHLVIDDAPLARIPISGTFQTSDQFPVLKALRETYGVRSLPEDPENPNVIHLKRANTP